MSKYIVLFFCLILSLPSFGFLNPEDTIYKVHETTKYEIIYSKEYEHLVPLFSSKLDAVIELYDKEYTWEWDEKPVIILASSNNELTNGFATQSPRLFSVFFPGGPEFMDDFATKSWIDVLLVHEVAHLYQLNIRRQYSKVLKDVLGNPTPGFGIPFTYMISPHLFTPNFIIEGNATFNEVRFNNGGRLYSPTYRALTLQMLKNDHINASRLINDHIEWPFGTEKYILGGYLQASLADRHGTEKTNSWFYTHADHFVNPMLLDQSFQRHFGESYETSIKEFIAAYKPLTDQQRSLPGDPIATSYQHNSFYQKLNQVSFIINDYKNWPELCIATPDKMTCDNTGFTSGRLLEWNNEWVTAQITRVSPVLSSAGVFDEGGHIYENTQGKYYYSLPPRESVYIKVSESFDEPKLYVRDQFYDVTHSTPYVTDSGDIYYFKQNGQKRSLYRNKRALFTLDAYAGRVAYVDAQNSVYFTGGTDRGSSLFVWRGSQFSEVFPSDLVVDAAYLGNNQWIVAEITDKGYAYHLTQAQERYAGPKLVNYAFIQNTSTPNMQNTAAKEEHNTSNDNDYSPWTRLKFNSIQPVLLASEAGYELTATASFSDPLLRHNINLTAGIAPFGATSYGAEYNNAMMRMNWFVFAAHTEEPIVEVIDADENDVNHLGDRIIDIYGLGIYYPLLSSGRWRSGFQSKYRYVGATSSTPTVNARYEREYESSLISSWNISWGYSPLFHWGGYRGTELELAHKYRQGEGDSDGKDLNLATAKIEASYDIWSENIFFAGYKAAWADQDVADIVLQDKFGFSVPESVVDATDFYHYSDLPAPDYLELQKTSAGYVRPVNLGLYFQVFPISLRRFALLGIYNSFSGRTRKSEENNHLFYEWVYGGEFEFLFFHKFPLRLLIAETDPSVKIAPSQIFVRLGGSWQF